MMLVLDLDGGVPPASIAAYERVVRALSRSRTGYPEMAGALPIWHGLPLCNGSRDVSSLVSGSVRGGRMVRRMNPRGSRRSLRADLGDSSP